jgi:peptide deformylase
MGVDTANLHIVSYPAAVLRTKAKAVPAVTDEVRVVAKRMIELMFEAEGVGLAAPQVGLAWRMFVCHVPESDDPEEERSLTSVPVSATREPMVCINPVLTEPERDLVSFEEGCLSLPDIRGDVRRPSAITLTALGLDAKPFTLRAYGLLARCWQHECDHLEGVLILDRMTQPSKIKNRQAVRSLEAEARLL